MTEKDLTDRKFYRAGEETQFAEGGPERTPQTVHPAYKLAFRDTDFLLRDELRPVRFQLELLKPDADLQLGMTANVVLLGDPSERRAAVLVPLTALTQRETTPAVWVVGPGNALELRPVQVRQYSENGVLLESGLKAGETVVAAGVHKLRAGQVVEPLAAGALFGTGTPAAPAPRSAVTPARAQ